MSRLAVKFRWPLQILLLLALFLAIHWWQTKPLASGVAPPLSGQLLNGEQLDLTSLQGRPVLVHFWASWCPVCSLEQNTIESLSQDHQLLSVAMQSGNRSAVQTFMEQQGLSFPVITDEHGILASSWGVRGVPSSFILDRDGVIRFTEVGYTTEIGLRTRLWRTGQFASRRIKQ